MKRLLHCIKTEGPEFTKEVCRQTLVFVRHMTRFTRFLQTWFVKNKRRFGKTKGGLSSNFGLSSNLALWIRATDSDQNKHESLNLEHLWQNFQIPMKMKIELYELLWVVKLEDNVETREVQYTDGIYQDHSVLTLLKFSSQTWNWLYKNCLIIFILSRLTIKWKIMKNYSIVITLQKIFPLYI